MRVTPHVAQNIARRVRSAIDGGTTRDAGYALSQRKRKRIEECFGWLKTIALMRKVRHRGGVPSPLALYSRLRRLQSGADAKSGRRNSGLTPGRSVSIGGRRNHCEA